MIEVKIILPPEIHELLKSAQELTGIARQDVAIGAYLASVIPRLKHADVVAMQMHVGLPRIMEVLQDEPKPKPKPRPKRKAAPKGKPRGRAKPKAKPSRKAARK